MQSLARLSPPVQVFSEAAIRHNIGVLEYSRTCQAAATGMASGILGLTGIPGFVFYFVIVMIQVLFLFNFISYQGFIKRDCVGFCAFLYPSLYQPAKQMVKPDEFSQFVKEI